MKPGTVARIRVSPQDSIGVIDLLHACGIDTTNKSFAACTSLALSSMLQIMRDNGIIQESDGFDYLEKVGPTVRDKRERMIQAIGPVQGPVSSNTAQQSMSLIEAQQILKKLHDKDRTDEEEKQYKQCMAIVYGE